LEVVSYVSFTDKKHAVSVISLSRITVGRTNKELSRSIEKSLRKRAANFFFRETEIEFKITKKLATIMPVKGITTDSNLYQDFMKVLQSLGFSIPKLAEVVADGAPRTVQSRSGVSSSLIASNVKNTTNHELICHCLIHQEQLGTKSLKMTNIVKFQVEVFWYPSTEMLFIIQGFTG
jgi:hypothetical protein